MSGSQGAAPALEKGSSTRCLLLSPRQNLEQEEGKKNQSRTLTSQIANEVLQHHLPVRLDVGAVHVRIEEDDCKGQDEDGVRVVKLLDHIWVTHAVPLAAAGGMHTHAQRTLLHTHAAARRATSQAACANACVGHQLAVERNMHPETSAHTVSQCTHHLPTRRTIWQITCRHLCYPHS